MSWAFPRSRGAGLCALRRLARLMPRCARHNLRGTAARRLAQNATTVAFCRLRRRSLGATIPNASWRRLVGCTNHAEANEAAHTDVRRVAVPHSNRTVVGVKVPTAATVDAARAGLSAGRVGYNSTNFICIVINCRGVICSRYFSVYSVRTKRI